MRNPHPSGSLSEDGSSLSAAEVESVGGLSSTNDSVEDAAEATERSLPPVGEQNSIKDLTPEALKMKRRSAKKVLIMDARSYAAAFGNRARGGGMECNEYYKDCEVEFMNLGNIHEVRKGFQRLRSLVVSSSDQSTWFSGLEATKWLYNISCLLSSAVRCAKALELEQRPVVVHCSDGWDRTSQITSLSQLLLDPYYRTMEGFEVLVEREWLSFGHKMADRNGGPFCSPDPNERCPVFLQWLDCVHQLLFQFPCAFQFNFAYLVKLARHAYSNLFGNFLFNSDRERREHKLKGRTRSIWAYLRYSPEKYVNYLYSGGDTTAIWPKSDVRVLNLWQEVYTDFFERQGMTALEAMSSSNGIEVEEDGGSAARNNNGSSSSSSSSSSPKSEAVEEEEVVDGGRSHNVISKASEVCGEQATDEAVELKDMKHLKVRATVHTQYFSLV